MGIHSLGSTGRRVKLSWAFWGRSKSNETEPGDEVWDFVHLRHDKIRKCHSPVSFSLSPHQKFQVFQINFFNQPLNCGVLKNR